MILTVTLNPLLERRLSYPAVNYGMVNRTNKETFKAGGKGINVSRQLNHLGVKNLALTFLGGNNGKILRSILTDEEINFIAVSSKSETRSATIAVEETKNSLTTFMGPDCPVSTREVEEFKARLEKMIQNVTTVIFSGSSPCPEADSIFPFGIELANKYDKVSILDTYGRHLKNCIEAGPSHIHNNFDEISSSMGIDLSTESAITHYLNSLYSRGITLAFITNGARPGYASKFDYHYKFTVPEIAEIDSTGSGDAFVAGIAYGLENSMVFEDFLKFASAAGVANAGAWDVCRATKESIEHYVETIDITTIGKKMKLIDDSPTI